MNESILRIPRESGLFEAAGVPVPYDGWTWDEFEVAMKKITALSGTRGFEDRKVYGGFFQIWPDTLRNLVWTFGGDFFGRKPDDSPDFRNVTLDEPRAQDALKFIARARLVDQFVYNPTGIAKDGGQEFFNGNIGCIGPIGQWMVPRYMDLRYVRARGLWLDLCLLAKTLPAVLSCKGAY
jgi:ABC-type glycerol-3-phosphate transport system substrate-binding protein